MSWSSWHQRLHKQLRRYPLRLPEGASLLLSISGGQDSMALLALVQDLQRLYHWNLHVWHGDHGWYAGSAKTATELKAWCVARGLKVVVDCADPAQVTSEAAARCWRYQQLAATAAYLSQKQPQQPYCHVLTAHTASDRAETMLLNLARGTDLAGLGSLPPERNLDAAQPDGLKLVRPLLNFSREDTAVISHNLALPVWVDPSNTDSSFDRNRIRSEVLPVMEAMHPGCSRRLARLADRLSHVQSTQTALAMLALQALQQDNSLDRRSLAALPASARSTVLAAWLRQQQITNLNASLLEELAAVLGSGISVGGRDLSGGWRICWQRELVRLCQRQVG
ncbi:tRNA lysidine(34) synthetase TilS [cyanobiont of Ornithocercus magnificus]|nr:tRNA lysidine(34) synthetase TilS [cyanobiont of Ornithocercus magnificus]